MTKLIDRSLIFNILNQVFGPVLHEKRVLSLSLATLGICFAGRASIAGIGRALAGVTGKKPKHGIKQVDRMLSNDGIDLDVLTPNYVRWIVADRKEITAALDWTDYDKQELTTIRLCLVTSHGRATPLCWRTVSKDDLKDRRNDYEDELIETLAGSLPEGVKVTLLADRGFGDTKLYAMLNRLGWDYVIRFRGCIKVSTGRVAPKPASDWVPPNGRIETIRGARVTAEGFKVGAVVCVQAPDMKEPWCLATSLHTRGTHVVKLYGRRFTIEETFRDEKDDRFGLGLAETAISTPERRDRLHLVAALSRVFLTFLGAAGAEAGLEAGLQANTRKDERTYALFNQGRLYAAGIGVVSSMVPILINALTGLLAGHSRAQDLYGLI